MKYLLLLTSILFSLSFLEGSSAAFSKNGELQLSPEKGNLVERAFASFVTRKTQTFSTPVIQECDPAVAQPQPITCNPFVANISFEKKLSDENIRRSHDFTTFTVKKEGFYGIEYGVTLLAGPGVFSLHKNQSVVIGSELGVGTTGIMGSQAIILFLRKGDKITLSLDTLCSIGGVVVGSALPNGNGAYIDFVRID